MLEARDLVKTYPGVRALDGVSFDVRAGEVHALVGENGAGKSTLINVLSGVTVPDSGSIVLDGARVSFPQTNAALRAGIGVVFQELSLSENLSIAENIFGNRQPVGRFGLIDRRELKRRAVETLALFDWDPDPDTPVNELSASEQQLVEIIRALSENPRILILDEPTSSLSSGETRMLFQNILRLRDCGVGVIYISHHLKEIFEVADRVTVLRDGRRVDTCNAGDVTEEDLVRKMVGRKLEDLFGSLKGAIGKERLRISGGCRDGVFQNIGLSVNQGEIVGMAGLAGAGRTELGRAIFGAEPLDSGEIHLNGTPLAIRSPATAIRHGIAYMTEARKEDGLFLDMGLRENCAAPSLSRFSGNTDFIDEAAITRFSEECRERFRIAAGGEGQKVGELSGGNQQKALLAMWIGTRPTVLIADEPTRGVDVGARSEIYHMLRDLAGDGMAILLISSDLPELLGLSDRILVMRQGRLAGEFNQTNASEESILACAAGVDRGNAL